MVSLFKKERYYLSYDFEHKALWIRTYKTGSRTINDLLKENCQPNNYIYSSAVAFQPNRYKDFFKFTFVRNPEDRLVSAWKDKVLRQNYFHFTPSEHEKYKNFDNFLEYVSSLDLSKCDEHLRKLTDLVDFKHIDFIGRLENFDEDLTNVANKLGISYTPKMLNKTNSIAFELNSEQKAKIHSLYKEDFDLLYPEKIEIN